MFVNKAWGDRLLWHRDIFEDVVDLYTVISISDLRFLLVKSKGIKKRYINKFKEYDICDLCRNFSYVFNIEISNYEDIESSWIISKYIILGNLENKNVL